MTKFAPACAAVLGAVAMAISSLAAGETIRGRVIEAGASGSRDVGIDEVIVRVMDAGGKVLGSTATDETGYYNLEVAGAASKATFDKIDYTPQPATRTLARDRTTQADVFLGKKNGTPTYYLALAKAFNQSDREKVKQYAEIVDALPKGGKDLVVESLTSNEARAALSHLAAQRQPATMPAQWASDPALRAQIRAAMGANAGTEGRAGYPTAAPEAAAASEILRERSIRLQNQVRDGGALRGQ